MKFLEIKEIGSGGMGKIYTAFSSDLNRRVTLKTLHRALSSDPHYQARLKKEAEILALLSHPNIVPFIGYETVKIDTQQEPCLIMEQIDGITLQERLNIKGSMAFEETLPLFLELCDALGYLHQRAIFHLDLNPDNLLLNGEGRLFLTDFGIASVQKEGEKTSPLQDPMGTLPYTSPEQVRGEHCDGRSDLYSLGMILYALLNGKGYFSGMEKKRIWGELVYETKPFQMTFPEEVPSWFQNMIRKLAAKKKEARYPDIKTVLHDFHRQFKKPVAPLSPQPFPSFPSSKNERGLFSEKRMILAAGLVVILVAFFYRGTWGPAISSLAPPPARESASASLRLTEPAPPSGAKPAEPVIHLASLTRVTEGEGSEEESLSPVLSDNELERILLEFKSDIENKNFDALKKKFDLSSEAVSYFQKLFQKDSKPEVEIRQVQQEGVSVQVQYQIAPRSFPGGEGLLLYQGGVWHLSSPVHS